MIKGDVDEEGLLGGKGLLKSVYQRLIGDQAKIGFDGCHDVLVARTRTDPKEQGLARRRGTPRPKGAPRGPPDG